jgi:hypothetical protein
LPASATYTGIPTYGSTTGGYGDVQQLRMRTIADVENASGPIYTGYPESFEIPDATVKGSYNMNTADVPDNSINLKTGNWKLEQAILGNLNATATALTHRAVQCIRMQQSLSSAGLCTNEFRLNQRCIKSNLTGKGAIQPTYRVHSSFNTLPIAV